MATASGPMPTLRFARVETSIGPMWVAETDVGVAAVSRSEPFAALRRRFPGASVEPGEVDGSWIEVRSRAVARCRRSTCAGSRRSMPAVYECVRADPAGETVTYGEVAALIGSPGAARAVGGAMSRCPLFPAVPCHRVVRASDGWSGWGSDPALKRRLLGAERGARG